MNVIDWKTINYKEGWEQQESHFQSIIDAKKQGLNTNDLNTLFLCEHPHVYTLGRNGNVHNMLINEAFLNKINAEFYKIDRGGDITYHGPGQLVGYPILDLEYYKMTLKKYVYNIEEALIQTVAQYGIVATRLEGATGVWIDAELPNARKIAAIGVRASRFVTMHGFALNVNTDLSYFNHINPCGFVDKSVTSIEKELGNPVEMNDVKTIFVEKLKQIIK